MTREELLESESYKATKIALEWYKNHQDADALEGFEAGWEASKKELIDKACEWLRKELVNFEDYNGMGEDLINDFCKAMEE